MPCAEATFARVLCSTQDIDPVFQLLKKAKLPEASKRVHHYSTQVGGQGRGVPVARDVMPVRIRSACEGEASAYHLSIEHQS
jgi:hypothetical protein